MDVKKQFTLKMVGLFVAVIVLSVLVFFSATNDSFQQDDPVIDAGDSVALPATEEESFPEEVSDVQDSTVPDVTLAEKQDDVVATVTLSESQAPEKQLRQQESAANDLIDDDTASYTVSLRASWSEQLHPHWYPQGAHLSPMIAWSHRLKDILFREHGVASDGMEIMAETGAPSTLVREIQNSILAGASATYATGSVFNAPGVDIIQMTMTQDAPYVTVVSMIAPSPDWFITARNVELYRNGEWLSQVHVPAALYDAGTDSGTTFTSEDDDTDPQQSISKLRNAPSRPIATFEFVKN